MKKIIIPAIIALAVAASSAWAEVDAKAKAEAKKNFESKCAVCHGKDGKGETTMGKKLEVKDYTDPKAQEELKDEEAVKAIKEGVKKGNKTVMKAYDKDYDDGEIKALIAYIRDFKKK